MSPQKGEKLRYKGSSEYANAKNKLIKATKVKLTQTEWSSAFINQ